MPDFAIGSTYYQDFLDIYASSHHAAPISYMVNTGGAADANGDKILYEGQVLETGGSTYMVPHTSGTAVGVLAARVNCRLGAVEAPVLTREAWLVEGKCRDNGVFGTVTSGAKTSLANNDIHFSAKDG